MRPRISFPFGSTSARTWTGAGVLALAVAVRLGSWSVAFQPAGVALLGDTDPHYHVVRAERMLHGAPGAPWHDPAMNWPYGADVFWPPLFDAVIAGGSRLAFGSDATREQIARVGAFLPVLLGAISVLLVAALGRAVLGRRRGWLAAFLVAALPAHAAFTVIGRPDHHAAELAFFPAVLLLFARAWTDRGARTAAAALAVLVAAAFWTWQGSPVLIAVPVAFTLAWWVWAPPGDPVRTRAARAVAAAGLGGAAVLVATLAAFGPPAALVRPAIDGVNALSVAVALGTGLVGLLLLALERSGGARGRSRRVAEAAAAVLLPAALLLAVSPALRAAAIRGATALARGSPWYDNIEEYRPLLLDGTRPLTEDLGGFFGSCGLAVIAAVSAACFARARWRRPAARPGLVLLAVAVVAFGAAALARRRFVGYLVVAAAVPAELAVRAAVAAIAARLPRSRRAVRAAAAAALALVLAAPAIRADLHGVGPLTNEVATAMETFAIARELDPAPGREAVLAPWALGHLVQYVWDRPVVVTPFGIEGGAGAFEAWAAFFFEADPVRAEAALAARRVAFVVVDDPSDAADKLHGFAPPGSPPYFAGTQDVWIGAVADATADYWTLVPARLYHGDGCGGGPAHREPLSGFRLLLEAPPDPGEGKAPDPMYKVFGVVPGATVLVSGARPAGTVEATARVRTNLGRTYSISFWGRADDQGRARLRLPYASGMNGRVQADGWLVTDGEVLATLTVSEVDVMTGRTLALGLPSGVPRSPHPSPRPAAAARRD